jgi:regulator of CtrA degradation
MREQRNAAGGTVDFFARFSGSEQFERVFKQGMNLVEETANYLDGEGRTDSRALDRAGAIAYATESMRLTTRLMQIASWLLVQRAVSEGEMTAEEASREKYRLGAKEICRGRRTEAAEILPPKLVELLDRSATLYERVERLDQLLYAEEQQDSGLQSQINRLQMAFGALKGE